MHCSKGRGIPALHKSSLFQTQSQELQEREAERYQHLSAEVPNVPQLSKPKELHSRPPAPAPAPSALRTKTVSQAAAAVARKDQTMNMTNQLILSATQAETSTIKSDKVNSGQDEMRIKLINCKQTFESGQIDVVQYKKMKRLILTGENVRLEEFIQSLKDAPSQQYTKSLIEKQKNTELRTDAKDLRKLVVKRQRLRDTIVDNFKMKNNIKAEKPSISNQQKEGQIDVDELTILDFAAPPTSPISKILKTSVDPNGKANEKQNDGIVTGSRIHTAVRNNDNNGTSVTQLNQSDFKNDIACVNRQHKESQNAVKIRMCRRVLGGDTIHVFSQAIVHSSSSSTSTQDTDEDFNVTVRRNRKRKVTLSKKAQSPANLSCLQKPIKRRHQHKNGSNMPVLLSKDGELIVKRRV